MGERSQRPSRNGKLSIPLPFEDAIRGLLKVDPKSVEAENPPEKSGTEKPAGMKGRSGWTPGSKP